MCENQHVYRILCGLTSLLCPGWLGTLEPSPPSLALLFLLPWVLSLGVPALTAVLRCHLISEVCPLTPLALPIPLTL